MKISNLYYSNAQMSNSFPVNTEIIDLPIEINNRMHYLATHCEKIYNAEKAENYRKCVEEFDSWAKYFSCDIYADDETLPNIGVIRLFANNMLLHDEYTPVASVDLLSMLNRADEVVVESYNCNNSDSLVLLTLKFYLYDLTMDYAIGQINNHISR